MAQVVVTLKIMPDGPDTNLDTVEQATGKEIADFGGEIGKKEVEPVAFGLQALKLLFVMDESLGSTEELENKISRIDGVNSVEVVDVRRAVG